MKLMTSYSSICLNDVALNYHEKVIYNSTTFLENVMRVMGRPQKWRNYTYALYRTGTTTVLLADVSDPSFRLQRSMTQGSPLALYTNLFTIEAFFVFFQEPSN